MMHRFQNRRGPRTSGIELLVLLGVVLVVWAFIEGVTR